MDFDINTLDSDDSHSDGNNDGGDGDFVIFDFNEEVMIHPNEARHIHHKDPLALEACPLNKVFDMTIMLLR